MIVFDIDKTTSEVYLGDVSISEVYIGDERVFPTRGIYGNKFYGEYLNGETLTLECEGKKSNLTLAELTSEGNPSLSALTNATFGGCLRNIADYGNCSFSGLTNLSSVTISEGTKTLHKNTFERCSNLKTVTFPETLQNIIQEAFYFCNSLSSVTLGSDIRHIGDRAFAYCSSLTSITIKATTPPYLGMGAFNNTNNCPIYVPCQSIDAYKSASGWSNYGDRIQCIPNKLSLTYNDGTKYEMECNSSTTLTHDEIYENSPKATYFVTSAEIGKCTTTIGDNAFGSCTNLSSVTIPSNVTSIGQAAFQHSNLTSVTIPNGITEIKKFTFDECTDLSSVTIPDSVTLIDEQAFGVCIKLDNVIIPDSVTTIGDSAFHQCSAMTTCTIGSGVTEIQSSAFRDCSSLTSITIPNSVTEIEQQAFRYCSGLTSVTIGSGITAIGYDAFDSCPNILSITINATTPPLIQGKPFTFAYDCVIYVPCQSIDAYKTATNWSTYADRITCIQPLNNKLTLTYNDSTTYSLECESSSSTITKDDVSGGTRPTESIVSAEIGDCVTTIDAGIFTFCTTLTSVTIGSGVTSIGVSAFYGCTSLTSVTVNAITPPSLLLGDVFTNTNNCPIYVPAESVEIYKAARGWSTYAARIQPLQT